MTPKILFKLYLCWYVILVFWFYAYTIQMPYEPNDRFGVTDILFSYNFMISGLIIFLKTIFTLFSDNENQDCLCLEIIADIMYKKQQDILTSLGCFTAVAYGMLSVYYLYLFQGNTFAGYQPSWTVYLILSISVISLIYFVPFSKFGKQSTRFKIYRKYLRFFSYGFCFSCILVFFLLLLEKLI